MCKSFICELQVVPSDQSLCAQQGLLPRGKNPNPLRERNAEVNELVQGEVAALPHASYLNVDPGFVHTDGTIWHQDLYITLRTSSPPLLSAHTPASQVCEPLSP